ncbi:acid sphingomyelinase-like phosphodiesterase 3b [Ornithodoros turicata]|uniref:acid sphingomyelinase-like phosphodiesterase 3b n=1 Tax=Ornithodoros turicata TaxID=34597 RepID=UPI00313A3186
MRHHRVHGHGTVGHYGDFHCDSPEALIRSALEAMAKVKPNPDFVLWTGDNSAHSEDSTLPQVYSDNRFVSILLSRHTFNKTVIVPALGNHECVPPNVMPPSNSSFYRGFLTRGGYAKLLVGASTDTFEKGGYYSRQLNKHLRILVLNNVLWYAANQKTCNMHDPSDQMHWLQKQLEDARSSQQKVFITGHIAPGFNNRANPGQVAFQLYHKEHSMKFNSLMSEYADIVAGQFYGHQHSHAFVLISSGSGSVSTAAHLSGSVTPWGSIHARAVNISIPVNPSVRLYKYDRSTGNLLDYTVYFMNLTQANADYDQARTSNEAAQPNMLWQPLYTFTTAYNVPDASTASVLALYAKMVAGEDVIAQYVRYTTSLKDFGPCDDFCIRVHLCAIGHTDTMDYQTCMNSDVTRAKARKQMFHLASSPQNDTSDRSTTMRDVAIGLSVSALIVVWIILAVRAKRASMMTGPRYAHFT